MITVKELTFCYAKASRQVLNGISLSFGLAERWAVIGRNGVGKSTLVRCIAGLEPQYAGSIQIENREVTTYQPRELAKILSYVPQTHGFDLPYTVYEYVMMGRFPYQGFMASATDEDTRIVQHALELTDTASFAERPMNRLSGGELQLVLLAGAVSQRTRILLLDEPATFLDPFHQELIQLVLERIHREQQCTILTVTHDVNTALNRYENVLALVNGSVYYAGKSETLVEKYTSSLREIFGISFVKAESKENRKQFVMPDRI